MNENSNLPIDLRSGRVVRRISRERIPRRVRRTGSAPPITHVHTHESPRSSPLRGTPMGDVNNDQVPPIEEEELPLSHYSNPSIVNTTSCIVHPHPHVAYEIKHSTLSILPTFHGVAKERPYDHIIDFDDMCGTLSRGALTYDELKLRLFQFSLKEKARVWFHKLKPRSILSWDDMQKVFLNAYYPHYRTTTMRNQLTTFMQGERETIYDAWERFKDLELGCPHHGISKWQLVSSFYNGLFNDDRRRLDNACGGSFQRKGPNAALDIIEEIAVQSGQWDHHDRRRDTRSREREERDEKPHSGRVHGDVEHRTRTVHGASQIQQVDELMNAKFEQLEAAMNTKLDLLLKTQGGAAIPLPSKQVQAISTTCFYCGSPSHEALDCEYYLASMGQEVSNEQLYHVDEYNPKYHPSKLNNHPSYSYGKKHVENYSLVNTQGNQGGGYHGGGNTYQGRQHEYQGPNTFQKGTSNPIYSQEASTS